MNAIIDAMVIIKKSAPRKAAVSKTAAWIGTAVAPKKNADGRARRMVRQEEDKLIKSAAPVGTTFLFEEQGGGAGQVIMAARIPTSMSRDALLALPNTLKRQVQEATSELNWSSAIVALADYALDVLEAGEYGHVSIYPDSDASGEGKVCSRLESTKPGKKVKIKLEAPLPGWHKQGRRRVAVPVDVRARIKSMIVEEGRPSFTGVLLGLAQFALEHLRKNKKRLLILPRNQG
jgi:hypothetical protein